jgi:hypothetical protein
MVAGAVPVEVTVTVLVACEPTAILPKLRLVALAESAGLSAAIPFPRIATVAEGLLAESLVIVTLPVALPSAFGLNFTFNDICWFGCSTCGRVNGTPENDPPATVMDLTVSGAVPFEVSVMVLVSEELTVVSPKSTLAGTEIEADVVPVPVKLIALGLPLTLSVSVIWPFSAPEPDGAKVTGNVTCCPGASVNGVFIVPVAKSSPLTAND